MHFSKKKKNSKLPVKSIISATTLTIPIVNPKAADDKDSTFMQKNRGWAVYGTSYF